MVQIKFKLYELTDVLMKLAQRYDIKIWEFGSGRKTTRNHS